jgi:hypothetical protein
MAHVLSITDGTITVALAKASGYNITNEALGTDEDAIDRANPYDPKITSSFDMLLLAAVGDMSLLARAVESLLSKAKRRQNKPEGPRVYLQLQIHGEASAWRAEITDGRFKPQSPLVDWFSQAVPYRLVVTHRAWEGPRKELSIGTSALSAATGGRAITQKNNDHFITVAADQVGGSLPAYVELQLTNTSGSAVAFRNYYLGVSDYGTFTSWFEGEDRLTGFGTVTSESTNSGSPARYNAYSFTNTGFMQWDISSLMGATEGRNLKILARFFSLTGTGLYIWPILRDTEGVIELARAPEETYIASANSRIMDLGSMPFPPGGYNPTATGARLELNVRATGAGTVNLDYFFLMPLDSYQYLYQRGYSAPNNGIVIFDNIEELYYISNYSIFSPREGRLTLRPGVAQRLYILADEGSFSTVARTFSVRAYVRERRLTI